MKKGKKVYKCIAITNDNNLCIPPDEKVENGNYTFCDGCHLHGELESIVGYDCFLIESSFNLDKIDKGLYFKRGKTGIYRCKIFLNGKYENCIFYYWQLETLRMQKGLLVLENDENARKYALKCYTEKKWFI